MKRERKKMKKGAKIALIVASSVFGFFFLTFVVTFLGGELPWTAHRSSAIYMREGSSDYEGYEDAGQKLYLDKNESKREEQTKELIRKFEELRNKFGIRIYFDGIKDDKWIRVACDDDENIFIVRGILSLYAKWNDIPFFWHIIDMDGFRAD